MLRIRAPFVLVLLLSIPPAVRAAPGYTVELIAESAIGSSTAVELLCPGQAINDRGDVAYRTAQILPGFHRRIRVYVATKGQAPQLVYEEDTNGQSDPVPVPFGGCNSLPWALGINNDRIVSMPVAWVEVDGSGNVTATNDVGYALIEPGVGIVREMRDLIDSSGRVSDALQVAGTSSLGRSNEITVTDGVTVNTVVAAGVSLGGYPRTLDEAGNAVVVGQSQTNPGAYVIQRAAGLIVSPPQLLGPIADWNSSLVPGFNDRGWLSLETHSDNATVVPDPTVVLIDPNGNQSAVARGSEPVFENFYVALQGQGGTAVNNFNRVAFFADTIEDGNFGSGSDSLWVGDASGNTPRRTFDRTEVLTIGARQIQLNLLGSSAGLNAQAMNDAGEIAIFSGFLDSAIGQRNGLFVARPNPGTEPGTPMLPPPGDELPGGGWQLPRCPFMPPEVPCFVDPPVAAGYEYTLTDPAPTSFTSVLVPVALQGGDASFSVEWQGGSAPLAAGASFDFTGVVPAGVRQFRITGIDLLEALDPTDPTAFVAGVTFANAPPAGAQLTVVPLVENTDDFDQDGVIASQDNCPSVANAGQEDGDADGAGDVCDNCAFTANPSQSDVGGVGAAFGSDGIGDACQCGDVSGDGRITTADATLITRSLLVPPTATLAQPAQCNVGGSGACTTADAVIITRALLVPPIASVQQSCEPASSD